MSNICKHCGTSVTWDNVRREYGRMATAGHDKQTIKLVMPLCGRCMTKILNGTLQPIVLTGGRVEK